MILHSKAPEIPEEKHYICIRSAYDASFPIEKNRLRLNLTREYCVPSLVAQTNKDFDLAVWVAPDDPLLEERTDLFQSIGVPVCFVLPSNYDQFWRDKGGQRLSDAYISASVGAKTSPFTLPTVQTRMDDDDAIASSFVARLQKSVADHPNKIWFAYRYGLVLFRDRNRLAWMSKDNNAFATRRCGLGECVFDVSHNAASNVQVIDNRFGWMWVRHGSNTSNSHKSFSRLSVKQVSSAVGMFGHVLNY